MLPYATQWITNEDADKVRKTLLSEYITQGPKVTEFERKVVDYCGAKYAVAVSSGTAALHAACFAAGVGPGDEVITSPITFVASANCVLYCCGKPVFADVQEDTINIDPKEIKNKITSKTKAIILIHFAGQPCELEEIRRIAKKHKLIIIEDACHALGAEYKGSKIGACKYSDMTVLSFHAVKHITTGEGGMILTNNENYYQKLLMFRTHGITRNSNQLIKKDEGAWYYEMQFLGFNYRLTDFQSALGLSQFNKLDKFICRRREIAERYINNFKNDVDLILPIEMPEVKSSWHLFVIRIKIKRKEVFDKLRQAGIGVNVHYIPVYLHPYYQSLGYKMGSCPIAEVYYDHAITLPLYPKMSNDDANYIIDTFKQIIRRES